MVGMTEEDQLFKFITMDGVTAPWVVDHYINGKQTSRINYESVQYNQTIRGQPVRQTRQR